MVYCLCCVDFIRGGRMYFTIRSTRRIIALLTACRLSQRDQGLGGVFLCDAGLCGRTGRSSKPVLHPSTPEAEDPKTVFVDAHEDADACFFWGRSIRYPSHERSNVLLECRSLRLGDQSGPAACGPLAVTIIYPDCKCSKVLNMPSLFANITDRTCGLRFFCDIMKRYVWRRGAYSGPTSSCLFPCRECFIA